MKPIMEQKEGFLSVSGRSLFYRYFTPPRIRKDSPVLVFLHEGLGCTEMWKDFPEKLSQSASLPALVYDRLGYGRSEPVCESREMDFLITEAHQYLPEILKNLGVKSPVILVGHSDGGSIALGAASRLGEQLTGIIAIAPHVIIEDVTRSGLLHTLDAWNNGDLKARLEKYHGIQTQSMFESWMDVWLRPEAMSWNLLKELESVRAPVLMIQGENDHFGTRQQFEEIRNHAKGRSELTLIPGCGHIPHLQAEQTVLKTAHRFIESLLPSPDEFKSKDQNIEDYSIQTSI